MGPRRPETSAASGPSSRGALGSLGERRPVAGEQVAAHGELDVAPQFLPGPQPRQNEVPGPDHADLAIGATQRESQDAAQSAEHGRRRRQRDLHAGIAGARGRARDGEPLDGRGGGGRLVGP